MQDFIGKFEKADGSGRFKFGLRLLAEDDGTFDFVTVLTSQGSNDMFGARCASSWDSVARPTPSGRHPKDWQSRRHTSTGRARRPTRSVPCADLSLGTTTIRVRPSQCPSRSTETNGNRRASRCSAPEASHTPTRIEIGRALRRLGLGDRDEVTYDESVDAAHIYLVDTPLPGRHLASAEVQRSFLRALDFNTSQARASQ